MSTGIGLAILAALWLVGSEFLYWRLILPTPPPTLNVHLLLYAVILVPLGLLAGVLAIPFARIGTAVSAIAIGTVLGFVMLGLRLADLRLLQPVIPVAGGLFLLLAVVACVSAWLASFNPDPVGRSVSPGILVAGCTLFLVVAARTLSVTSGVSLERRVAVSFGLVALAPILLALLCRRFVRGAGRTRVLVWLAWCAPLVVVVACASWGEIAQTGEFRSRPESDAANDDRQSQLPSIIWITIDATRADHLSVYGYGKVTTPNLEEFARSATVYRNCLAQAPSTCQSVPSMLSGSTPYRHRGITWTRPLSEDVVMLPEMLSDLGYRTIAVSANPWISRSYGMGQGFEEFYLYNTDDQLVLYDVVKLMMRLTPWAVYRLREYLPAATYVPIGDLVDDLAEIIETRDRGRPLFLFFQPLDPHGPYRPSRDCLSQEGRELSRADFVSYYDLTPGVPVSPGQLRGLIDRYDAEIRCSDAELGRLFGILRKQGLFDPSLIIITSDHGEQFQEHGLWDHGNSLYQPLLRVPLLVKYPHQDRGRVVDDWVASIDIVLSVTRLLGIECDGCEGQPLEAAGEEKARPLFAYYMNSRASQPLQQAVVSDGWKLIRIETEGEKTRSQLFHIDSDPHERNDLSTSRPDLLQRLAVLLEEYEGAVEPLAPAEDLVLDPAEEGRLRALGYVE